MKQVEKIWAELSAKAQEVETPQEVELSEEKVELGAIEDAIKQKENDAKELQREINGYAASARDVIASIESAEKEYESAKDAFKKFQDAEQAYNKELDRADGLYRALDQNTAFGKWNELFDLNKELERYNGKTFPVNESRTKEMREAVDLWKSIKSKFPKIK